LHKVTNASINCKVIEECCILDYKSVENNKYPDWNVQEQGKDWPDNVKKKHSEITKKSLKSKTKRTKIKM
jgi:hypothetical protein